MITINVILLGASSRETYSYILLFALIVCGRSQTSSFLTSNILAKEHRFYKHFLTPISATFLNTHTTTDRPVRKQLTPSVSLTYQYRHDLVPIPL